MVAVTVDISSIRTTSTLITMKIENVDMLLFNYDPTGTYQRLDIILGESFHWCTNKICIDTTPYNDETLIPIENIEVKENHFSFDFFNKKRTTKKNIDFTNYMTEGVALVSFIRDINEGKIQIIKTSDSFRFQLEKDRIIVRFENISENRLIILEFNKYRNYFKIRFPEPVKEYIPATFEINNQAFIVHCNSSNLREETDTSPEFTYSWNINLQNEIIELIKILCTQAQLFCHNMGNMG